MYEGVGHLNFLSAASLEFEQAQPHEHSSICLGFWSTLCSMGHKSGFQSHQWNGQGFGLSHHPNQQLVCLCLSVQESQCFLKVESALQFSGSLSKHKDEFNCWCYIDEDENSLTYSPGLNPLMLMVTLLPLAVTPGWLLETLTDMMSVWEKAEWSTNRNCTLPELARQHQTGVKQVEWERCH